MVPSEPILIDSDEFFVNAVEEFGLPGTAKEAASRRATMMARAGASIGSDSSHESADSDPSWANSPSWPLFETDNHSHTDFPSTFEPAENPSAILEDTLHSRVRAHFLDSTTLPSSQTARTPEPWVAELAPIPPPAALTEDSPAILPPSMVPTTPRQALDLNPLLWSDSSDIVDIPSNHVILHREESRRIPQTAQ